MAMIWEQDALARSGRVSMATAARDTESTMIVAVSDTDDLLLGLASPLPGEREGRDLFSGFGPHKPAPSLTPYSWYILNS